MNNYLQTTAAVATLIGLVSCDFKPDYEQAVTIIRDEGRTGLTTPCEGVKGRFHQLLYNNITLGGSNYDMVEVSYHETPVANTLGVIAHRVEPSQSSSLVQVVADYADPPNLPDGQSVEVARRVLIMDRESNQWLESVRAYSKAKHCPKKPAFNHPLTNSFSTVADTNATSLFTVEDTNELFDAAIRYVLDPHDKEHDDFVIE